MSILFLKDRHYTSLLGAYDACILHCCRRRKVTSTIGQSRRGVETEKFENVKGRMGESLGEVANESLESSEL